MSVIADVSEGVKTPLLQIILHSPSSLFLGDKRFLFSFLSFLKSLQPPSGAPLQSWVPLWCCCPRWFGFLLLEYLSGKRRQGLCLCCCLREKEGFFYHGRKGEVLGIQLTYLSIAAFVWPVPLSSFPDSCSGHAVCKSSFGYR